MIFAPRCRLSEMGPRKRDLLTVCIDASELDADIAAVDVLARVALLVHRFDYQLRLKNPSAELIELIQLAGLSEVLRS
jgi:ABC-type transporter Mla MlaB component